LITPPAEKFELLSAFSKNMNAAEIHSELCMAVYGQNVISERTIRQWYRMFKDGRQIFTMKSKVVSRPDIVSDDTVQSVDQKICERCHFTILERGCEFRQISCTVLCKINTVRLGYHKFCAKWVSKILTGVHKTQRMAYKSKFD
jgi:hypothetical protein